MTPDTRLEAGTRPLPAAYRARLVVEVLALYPRVRLGLWRRPAPEVVTRLRRGLVAGVATEEAVRVGYRLGGVVSRVLDPLPADSRCLVSSLVLTGMLARRGIAGTVVIGVRTEPSFAAHAWVEHGGRRLLPAGAYERLTEL